MEYIKLSSSKRLYIDKSKYNIPKGKTSTVNVEKENEALQDFPIETRV